MALYLSSPPPKSNRPPDIEAATLRSDRFRLEREVDWQRLERDCHRAGKGPRAADFG